MRDRSHAAAPHFPTRKSLRARRSRLLHLVQPAPGPETPDRRDKTSAQQGMIILLVVGGAFWAAVATIVIYLLR